MPTDCQYGSDMQTHKARLMSCQFFAYCFAFSLLGCGENSNTVVDSASLANLENKKLTKLSEIAKEKWDVVCVLTPYSGGVGDDRGDSRIKTIQQKKSELNLVISEGGWHLIFEKNGMVIANSFKRSEIDIEQRRFTAIREKLLDKFLFKPKYCMEFSQATIYKFNVQGRNYISLGVTRN